MKPRQRDYSQLLIWSAALVTVVRYSAAFVASDMGQITGDLSHWITAFMGITGLGMGILDVLGGVYLFDGWRRVMPKTGDKWSFKFRVLTLFVFGLMGAGICILVPFTVSRVSERSLFAVLGDTGFLWLWSMFVNIIPYFLIGGVATGNKLIAENAPEEKRNNSGKKSEENQPEKVRWNQVDAEDYRLIAGMKTSEIMAAYGIDERVARNWRVKAQNSVSEAAND